MRVCCPQRAFPRGRTGVFMDSEAKQAFEAGIAKARSGDPVGAVAAFTEALGRQPNWPLARLNRGSAYFLAKNFPAALADFDALLASDPNFVDAYINRAAVRRASGDVTGADADLSRAVELAPDNPAVIQTRAALRLRGGDAAGADADFSRLLAQNPRNLVARVNRAAARVRLGDLAGAVADCDDALATDPRHRDALVNRATARILLRDHAGAAADAEQILSVEPGSVEGLYIRGVARTALEQFPAALADLNEVVRRSPAMPAAWAARANAKYHLGDPSAAADYREAFKLDAGAATRVILRLVNEHAKYRPAEVLAECQKFRARDRTDAISLARRGLTRLVQGREADANLDLTAFRKLAPGDVAILDALVAAAKSPDKKT